MKLRLIPFAIVAVLAFASCRDKLTGPPNPSTSDTIAHWNFNGNLNDPYGHNATGGPESFGPDRFASTGEALYFPTNPQPALTVITVADTSGLNFTGNEPFTILAWIKTLDTGGIVFAKGPVGSNAGYQLGLSGGLPVARLTSVTGTNSISDYPVPVLNDGNWHLLTLVVSAGNNVNLYADSSLYMTYQDPGMEPEFQNTEPISIGSDWRGSNTWNGALGDILILNQALDPSEVAAHFHERGWYERPDTVAKPPDTVAQAGWVAGNFGTTQVIEGISFPIPNVGYACGLGGTLLKTTDSGTTWQAMASGTSQDLYRVSAVEPPNMQAQNVFFAVAGGNNGTVLRTTDPGGNTWTSVSAPFKTVNGALENVRDVRFINNADVVMVGGAGSTQTVQADGFVMFSTDAGATWTRSKTTSLPLYGIGVSSANLVTVVGNQGEIYSTTDLGNSWTDESVSDAGDDLSALDYSPVGGNLTAGIAATAYGTFYGTSDGGVGWGTAEQSPVTSALRTVKAISVGEWWMAGDNGVILHSLNDGGNWTRADISGVTVQWNEIVARDPNTLAFVGANGTLYWYKH